MDLNFAMSENVAYEDVTLKDDETERDCENAAEITAEQQIRNDDAMYSTILCTTAPPT